MSSPVLILPKRAAWVRKYNFDFSEFEEFEETPPQTISSASLSASSPAGLTIGSAVISGTTVQATFSGGTAGVSYTFTCTIITSGSATLTIPAKIEVLP